MPEIELKGGTIEYGDTGSGPVLVLVHGLLMTGSLWRTVTAELGPGYRCVTPTLPLGAHRRAMSADADLSMRGIAAMLGELIERLDLGDVTLVMNDWGGPQLVLEGSARGRVARIALCSCEAFDNVPPKGAARLLPLLARVPGGLWAALQPFRVHCLRRLPTTFGPLSKRPVPREVMDRWFAPALTDRAVRGDLAKYVRGSAEGRRALIAVEPTLAAFDGPALVAWATEDHLMPASHGRRLAALIPNARLVEVADSRTLIPEDQPALLAEELRALVARPVAAPHEPAVTADAATGAA